MQNLQASKAIRIAAVSLLGFGLLFGGSSQAKPALDNGAKAPKTDFSFVPFPIGQLVLISGKGTTKSGKGTELSSSDTEAVFGVPFSGLEPGTSVRVSVSAAAVAGSSVPGMMVDGKRVSRGPEIVGSKTVTVQTVAALPNGDGSFCITLAPQSKIRITALTAERLK